MQLTYFLNGKMPTTGTIDIRKYLNSQSAQTTHKTAWNYEMNTPLSKLCLKFKGGLMLCWNWLLPLQMIWLYKALFFLSDSKWNTQCSSFLISRYTVDLRPVLLSWISYTQYELSSNMTTCKTVHHQSSCWKWNSDGFVNESYLHVFTAHQYKFM